MWLYSLIFVGARQGVSAHHANPRITRTDMIPVPLSRRRPTHKSPGDSLTGFRAWIMVGTALRCAYGLGLYVREGIPFTFTMGQESLVRTWWSLYSHETCAGSSYFSSPNKCRSHNCIGPFPTATMPWTTLLALILAQKRSS